MRVTDTEFGDLLPMDDAGFFLAGDVRVNEQPGLVMLHTIFVRLHNHIAANIAGDVAANNPESDAAEMDELLYQHAKLVVAAIIQKITFDDWLPAIFGADAVNEYLGEYGGYDSSLNGAVCNIFSSAAMRFGHSMLPQRLPIRDADCNPVEGWPEDLEMRDSFFMPALWTENEEFMELLLNGFSCTLSNEVDVAATDSVRNFLFESVQDPLDLMALNIQRGRDHGLSDYNTVRAELGLDALTSFDELSSDSELNQLFNVLYRYDIGNIDLFLGLLAEDHVQGGSAGQLLTKIVLLQFKRLRDSDRFWYQSYIEQGPLRDFVEATTLKDVVEATTNIQELQTLDADGDLFQNENAISIFGPTLSPSTQSPVAAEPDLDGIDIQQHDVDNDGITDVITLNIGEIDDDSESSSGYKGPHYY